MSRLASASVGLSLFLTAWSASAQGPDEGVPHRLSWDYPRFRTSEYVASSIVSAAGVLVEFGIQHQPVSSWNDGILLDDTVRSALRLESPDARHRAAVASDYLWWGTQAFPIVVDSLIVPLVTDRGNADVAFQMLLLDWQAQSAAFLVARTFQRTVGRSRPLLQECAGRPGYDPLCSPENAGGAHESFLSGHTAMAFAGAALTCAHHQHLPLFGQSAADAAACALTLAGATTTGALRVMSDRHWTSDVLSGALIGLATGYALPYLTHYRFSVKGPEGVWTRAGVVPLATPTAVGLAMVGEL